MTQLIIVADITARPDKVELVKASLLKLIPITRTEPGCITYAMHQNNENKAHFLFFEIWESRELWQDHMNAPHLKAHAEATEGAIESVVLHEMTAVG